MFTLPYMGLDYNSPTPDRLRYAMNLAPDAAAGAVRRRPGRLRGGAAPARRPGTAPAARQWCTRRNPCYHI